MKKKAVFFGSYAFILPLLHVVHEVLDVQLIMTTESLSTDPVSRFAREHDIDLLAVKSVTSEEIESIRKIHADIAVLAYFGLFIPQEVLEMFPLGIVNVHPSLLPAYRGPTPVQTALLSGDKITGVSIIKLDTEIDHGPIYAQEKEQILPNDTLETLHARLFQKGALVCKNILPLIEKSEITPTPQDDSKATFTKKLTRESGYIDCKSPPSPEIVDRMIRAYYPWPGVWTTLPMKKFGKDPNVQTVRVKLLPNNMLQIEGKKPISLKDFYNGYPELQPLIQRIYQ